MWVLLPSATVLILPLLVSGVGPLGILRFFRGCGFFTFCRMSLTTLFDARCAASGSSGRSSALSTSSAHQLASSYPLTLL